MNIYIAWTVLIAFILLGVAPLIRMMATGASYKESILPSFVYLFVYSLMILCAGCVAWSALYIFNYYGG